MFRRILVANRGEIACRVIRAAHDLGIETIAVHSEADAGALHVRRADRAVSIGPAPPAESYLHVDRVLAAARETGCEAIHPGYGFLSENAGFVRRCRDAGIAFIGPTAASIESLADKVQAREAFGRVGLPRIPGTDCVDGIDGSVAAAERIGYPIMVKAAGGGGGIGMSRVATADALRSALETARTRAEKAFGDPRIYLEKWVDSPHHVEVQVFGDGKEAIHLFERECSIQRRFQKILEEARAPFKGVPRDRMATTAAEAAKRLGYVNAGTIECLVDGSGVAGGGAAPTEAPWYFLEMNRRIQVEHPVTEMLTGLDLVRMQIEVAATGRLPIAQSDVRAKGHALELRVCAEDPYKFFPSPGTISEWTVPEMEHVRIDAGVEAGSAVPIFYDPLLAKVVIWGETRDAAIDRALAAVRAMKVAGVKTNLPLFEKILQDDLFRAGDTPTGYLDDFLKRLRAKESAS